MESIMVKDLKKYFGPVKAVNGISFSVKRGEIFGMLGPNGAGKTTTVESLTGLNRRDAGEVQVMGWDPAKFPTRVKSVIGVQLQTAAMYPRLTVRELVRLYASFYPRKADINEVIGLVGLTEKAGVQTTKLSGGQVQRLSIALALVSDGDVIFLDEPTTGLDPQARRSLWEVISRMKDKGKTVFLTTHYMDEAETLCDRVAVVDHGKIIALDSPQALIRQYFREKAIELREPRLNNEQRLASLPGVKRIQTEEDATILYTTEVAVTVAALLEFAAKSNIPVHDLTVRTATLEDVFLELTGRRLRE